MRIARTTAIIVLIFVGLSGLVGAIPLMFHAHDEPWWMPQSLLRHSPFHSFLVPGIILFFAIGLLSCWVSWLAIRKSPGYGWWVALQGCVLLGWITVEVVMLRLVMWAQIFYAAVAMVLVLSGMILARNPNVRLQ
jgi:hypothetical protein